MRTTLAAIGAAAVTAGCLLAIALVALDAWDRHEFETLFPTVADGTSRALIEWHTSYSRIGLTAAVGGMVWATVVILPAALATRRFASGALQRLLAVAVVGVVSALAFVGFRTVHSGLPLSAFLLTGSVIGLAGLGVAVWVLPPNTSLERTRD